MKRGQTAPSAVIEEIGLDPRRCSGPAWPRKACRAGWENGSVIAGFEGLANRPEKVGPQLMFQAIQTYVNGFTTAKITMNTIATAGTSLAMR